MINWTDHDDQGPSSSGAVAPVTTSTTTFSSPSVAISAGSHAPATSSSSGVAAVAPAATPTTPSPASSSPADQLPGPGAQGQTSQWVLSGEYDASRSRQFETAKRIRPIIKAGQLWACDQCYRSKRKCDSRRPQCSTCEAGKKSCSYSQMGRKESPARSSKRRSRSGTSTDSAVGKPGSKSSYVRLLEQRVREMEQVVLPMLLPGFKPDEQPHDQMAQEERPGRRMEQQLPPEHDQNLAPAAIPESNFNNPANASISPASSLSSVATTSTSSSTFIPYTDSTFTLSPHHYQPNVPPPSFEYRQPDPIPQFHDPPPPPPTTITTTTTSPDPRLFPRAYTCPATPAWKTALFSHEVIQSLLHTHHTVVQPRIRGESMHVPTFFQIPRSKFVVYAYCAFAAGYCDHPTILAYRREFNVPLCRVGEVYYQAARGMLGQVLEEHSFDNARGLSAVGFYARECGEVSASLQYCGMAIRMALEIRLNIDPDVEEVHGPLTWVEKEQRRRWWLGMCIEEFMASQKDDRPSAIGETDRSEPINPNSKVKPFVNEAIFYSVTTWDGVPTTEALALMNEPGVGAVTAEATSLYLRALGLCGTVTSILRRSKSESPIQLDPSEDPVYLTMQRNALEHQITDWMNSLPTWISDISVYPGDDPTRVDRFEPWNIYSIHIVYHASFLVLHFPAMLVGGRPPHPSASSSSASTSSSTDALTHEHSYATCLHRARIVASLCRAMGPVAFFGYYMCWFLYHTALVLIMETRDAQRVGDEGRAQMGKRDLEAVVSVMECVSRRSFVGRHILEGIEAVMSEELEDVGALGVGVGVGVGSSSAVGGAGGGVGAGVWGTAGYEE